MSLKTLLEMNEKARRLVELMKRGIVDFVFTKVSTMKKRPARGTLRRDLIPKEAQRKRGRPRKRPDYLVIYYDLDKQAIRSFRDEMLSRIVSKPYEPGHPDENVHEDEENNKKTKSSEHHEKPKRKTKYKTSHKNSKKDRNL